MHGDAAAWAGHGSRDESFGDDIARDVVISSTGELLVVGEARTDTVPHGGYAMRVVP